jgi:acetylornithine/LysW-gamma-L-lysine aminotransferase
VRELPVGSHGSTFGGNPLACAAGLAVLDAFELDGVIEHTATTGAWLAERLAAIASPKVKEVRGLGLMLALDVGEPAVPYLAALVDEGVIALPAGGTGIRLLPPLVIERGELEELLAALERVLAT